MEFKTKKLDNASVELSLKFSGEEVEGAFKEAYRKARQKLKLPGFRQGKVPLDLVEKHLGDAVAEDAARELITNGLGDVIEELDPPAISVPRLDIESFDRNKGAAFRGTYDTFPKVKLGKYKKIKVTEDQPGIETKHIDQELERLKQEKATLLTREGPAVKDDFATLDITIKDGSESLYANDNLQIKVGGTNTLPGVDENIVGMQIEEGKEFEVEVEDSFPDPKYAGKKCQISVTLKNCQYPDYPELNDEFAKDVGEFETLAELKDRIKSDLGEGARQVLRGRAMQGLLDQVVQASKITLPESLVESELEARVKQIAQRMGLKDGSLEEIARLAGQDAEKIQTELRGAAEKSVRDRLVLSEISKQEKLDASSEEVDAEIQSRYGQFLPAEQMHRIIEDEEVRDDVRNRMMYWKTMEWIYEQADVKKGAEVPYDDLREEVASSRR